MIYTIDEHVRERLLHILAAGAVALDNRNLIEEMHEAQSLIELLESLPASASHDQSASSSLPRDALACTHSEVQENTDDGRVEPWTPQP